MKWKGKITKTRGCVATAVDCFSPPAHFPTVMGWAAYHFFSRFSRRRSTNPYSFPQVFSHQATIRYIDFLLYSQLFFCFSPFLFASLIHPANSSKRHELLFPILLLAFFSPAWRCRGWLALNGSVGHSEMAGLAPRRPNVPTYAPVRVMKRDKNTGNKDSHSENGILRNLDFIWCCV